MWFAENNYVSSLKSFFFFIIVSLALKLSNKNAGKKS